MEGDICIQAPALSYFLLSTNRELDFKCCQLLSKLHYSLWLRDKKKEFTDNLSLSSDSWGKIEASFLALREKCVTFINMNRSALHWKEETPCFKCLSELFLQSWKRLLSQGALPTVAGPVL